MPPKKMKSVVRSCVPEDILYEILTRLPVKSLCRFRCVSKSWSSVISDQKFMSLHLDHSLANPKLLLISKPRFYTSAESSVELVCSVDYVEWDIRNWRNQSQLVVADYHGLIPHDCSVSRPCLSVVGLSLTEYWNSNSLVIFNPSTRESIRFNLPDHPDRRCCFNKSYLGFDPVEKKHKVLSSWIHRINRSKCWNYVITLGEEDTWRPVECKYTHNFHFDSDDICIDGFIYYLSKGVKSRTYNLVGFDVRLETFSSTSVPLRIPDDVQPFLMKHGERVAVAYKHDKDEQQVIIMAMLIDNDKWKCEEYFVPPELLPLVWIKHPNGSTPNGELVFVSADRSNLLKLNCYDVETKHMKEIKVRDPKDRELSRLNCYDVETKHIKACPHVERLQSLQGLSSAFYHYKRFS